MTTGPDSPMPTAPRVSMGMPVYNGEPFLESAIEALLAQTFEDFELIISDNGSTDATPAICRRFEARDARVRFYRHRVNRGAAWNHNFVFARARGQYFKWAAADDLHDPTYVAECVRVLDADPRIAWCHSRTSHIDQQGRPIGGAEAANVSYVVAGPSRESARPSDRFQAIVLGAHGCTDVFGLMRHEVVARTALHLPIYGSDKVFVAELGLLGRFKEIPRTLFYVRVHSGASGSLATVAQQHFFIAAEPQRLFSWCRMHLLRGYLDAIERAGLPAAERRSCWRVLVRYLLQVNKWGRLFGEVFTGRNEGGGELYEPYRDEPASGVAPKGLRAPSPSVGAGAYPSRRQQPGASRSS